MTALMRNKKGKTGLEIDMKKIKKLCKPLLIGSLTMELRDVDDHYSLMELFRRKVTKSWCINEEFWDMMQEYMDYCPKKFLYPRK